MGYNFLHVVAQVLTDDSSGTGNLVEWSSTPESDPLAQSSVLSFTIDGEANMSSSHYLGSLGVSCPSFPNGVVSEVVPS